MVAVVVVVVVAVVVAGVVAVVAVAAITVVAAAVVPGTMSTWLYVFDDTREVWLSHCLSPCLARVAFPVDAFQH